MYTCGLDWYRQNYFHDSFYALRVCAIPCSMSLGRTSMREILTHHTTETDQAPGQDRAPRRVPTHNAPDKNAGAFVIFLLACRIVFMVSTGVRKRRRG